MRDLEHIRSALPQWGYNDYLRHLGAVEEMSAQGKPLRVAVLRSYTAEPMEPVLRLRLMLDGFLPSIWIGGFNQYVQEILDSGSPLHQLRPNLVLMMIRIEEVMPDFVDEFAARPRAEWEERISSKVRELGGLVGRIVGAFPTQVVVQNMSLPCGGYHGIHESQRPDGQGYLIQEFNRALAKECAGRKGVYVWDFDRFVRARG
jgi:predicted enzyme involved in methoxymalonyl-ACP biosynthesis